ncbi:hypothetical protein [Brucella anthropi]|uniref:hypothetical protein n=1 Tax=Brucella anthropi TaxID=529 RepID=UPI001CFF48E9|nr:hypothetical protein [Brucella anthropi]
MRRVIQIALVKRGGRTIPTSGDEARKNDIYLIYLLDSAGMARFLVCDLVGDQVQGKWSLDGQSFNEKRSIDIVELAKFKPWIQHYYRGWTFYTIGLSKFLLYRWTRWPWIQVTYDRYLQSVFNKRELPRQDRMKVMRYILAETVKDRAFQTHPTNLLTHFYTSRWVHRPDREELMTYYTLLLASMKEAKDLEETHNHGFKLRSQALNTITSFDLEEQRHTDNKNTQNRIFWLTVVLIVVGIVQAGAMAYDTWWKSPDTFSGTIGGQVINLIKK